jgi:two-component system CheB/CheR fusion protein
MTALAELSPEAPRRARLVRLLEVDVKSVLLVDDEFALTDTLKEFLEYEGYAVECAGNGKEALEVMDRQAPDLVVSDMMMPIMDGYRLLHAMRARPALKSIPVLLTSAISRTTVLSRDAVLEFSGFLQKPVKLKEFLALVVKLIGPA